MKQAKTVDKSTPLPSDAPAPPGAASGLCEYETLANLNNTTAKFAKFIVRVLDPQVREYDFFARGEKIQAKKFECVLVSANPAEYLLGSVPFSFSNRQAADHAAAKFFNKSVWELTTPSLDSKAKKEFISTPLKRVILLMSLTQFT